MVKSIAVYDPDDDNEEDFIWYIPDGNEPYTYEEVATDKNLVFHRYEGPAVCLWNVVHEWCILGNVIDETDYAKWMLEMDMDIDNLTDEDKLLIDVRWGGK